MKIVNGIQDERIKTNRERIEKVERHIETTNKEMGEVRDSLAKVVNDVSWLKQYFWVVVTSSVGALVAAIINIVLKQSSLTINGKEFPMEKEITNGLKKDLQMVLCPQMTCLRRGDFSRCYLHIYITCPRFTNKPPQTDSIWKIGKFR